MKKINVLLVGIVVLFVGCTPILSYPVEKSKTESLHSDIEVSSLNSTNSEDISSEIGKETEEKVSSSLAENISSVPLETSSDNAEVQEIKQIEVTFENDNLKLGDLAIIKIKNLPDNDIENLRAESTMTFKTNFFNYENYIICLLPMDYYNNFGNHKLDIYYKEKLLANFNYTVADGNFEVQNLTVDQTISDNTINSNDANEEYNKFFNSMKEISISEKYWDGAFILPVSDERITTPFAVKRYVNGSTTPQRHGALDMAMPLGTPVAAANNGKVLFADFLAMTGNSVVIEHGFGLKTWYYHMDSLSVSKGDMVQQGDIIGTVGTTGFSTGPHLHYALSVNTIWVNPYLSLEEDFLF
ncbi:MAG: M23 family metallopeptidase [Oscillospiraceae bacterium]